MTYSIDFRKKVLQVRKEKGLSILRTSELFKISPTSLMKWSKNILPKVERIKPATKIDMGALINDIKESPDSYQYERAIRFGVGTRAIGYALKRLQVTYKKNAKSSASENRRTYY
ncbi:MAG: IS630 transposase-related protein, partial [Janthinobacterium lividum]